MGTVGKAGAVLLVNLGTPADSTPAAIRRYLAEFLSDRRVVALSRALWFPILYGYILPFRPGRLAEKYRLIWTNEGSPLLKYSRRLTERVREQLTGEAQVALAMRYGEPGISAALLELSQARPERLIVLPLYPQYSTTTTASVVDAITARLPVPGWTPRVEFIEHYHDDPRYIAALADSVRAHWLVQGRGDHLLMSFHGIPEKLVAQGDPYARECHETARLLARALELDQKGWSVAFQSRLGRAPWIKPYTDHELPRLANAGVRTLDVICAGFPADCLETLEEVAIRYEAQFRAAGGIALRYIPALNDSPAHVSALAGIVGDRLKQ
jgi:ferrochelatase